MDMILENLIDCQKTACGDYKFNIPNMTVELVEDDGIGEYPLYHVMCNGSSAICIGKVQYEELDILSLFSMIYKNSVKALFNMTRSEINKELKELTYIEKYVFYVVYLVSEFNYLLTKDAKDVLVFLDKNDNFVLFADYHNVIDFFEKVVENV